MTPTLADAARKLLATGSGEVTSTEVAAQAAHAFEQLLQHLSRLLGETGIRTLLARSVHLASASFPWLAGAKVSMKTEGPSAALRECMESQSPEAATEAFVLVLSTLVGLLMRLIGEALTTRVLHHVWPAVFPHAAAVKENT